MAVIKEDEHGLYVAIGGYKAREVTLGSTRFKVGERVKTHHFGGSTRGGVGKDETCKKGQYLEYWVTCGDTDTDVSGMDSSTIGSIEWYRKQYNERI